MPSRVPEQLSKTIETLYGSESGRILATLVRLLGDLDLAEEAMHEAFAAALDTWPQTGIPEKPRPWLISTARFKAIDAMRQRARFDAAQRDLALHLEARINEASHEDEEIEDDRLRLIFTCCHPCQVGSYESLAAGIGLKIKHAAADKEVIPFRAVKIQSASEGFRVGGIGGGIGDSPAGRRRTVQVGRESFRGQIDDSIYLCWVGALR
jgi:hypothetical protein